MCTDCVGCQIQSEYSYDTYCWQRFVKIRWYLGKLSCGNESMTYREAFRRTGPIYKLTNLLFYSWVVSLAVLEHNICVYISRNWVDYLNYWSSEKSQLTMIVSRLKQTDQDKARWHCWRIVNVSVMVGLEICINVVLPEYLCFVTVSPTIIYCPTIYSKNPPTCTYAYSRHPRLPDHTFKKSQFRLCFCIDQDKLKLLYIDAIRRLGNTIS